MLRIHGVVVQCLPHFPKWKKNRCAGQPQENRQTSTKELLLLMILRFAFISHTSKNLLATFSPSFRLVSMSGLNILQSLNQGQLVALVRDLQNDVDERDELINDLQIARDAHVAAAAARPPTNAAPAALAAVTVSPTTRLRVACANCASALRLLLGSPSLVSSSGARAASVAPKTWATSVLVSCFLARARVPSWVMVFATANTVLL
jgi:hypothetical protein